MASFSFFLPEKFSLENREHIYLLQQALTALKYEIVQQEITDREYGESTKVAVASFQQAHALGITVAPSSDTISAINKELQQLYRIFGIFTNKSSMPVFAATAVLLIDGKETTSELTLQDGSFRFYPTFGSYYLDARGQLRYYPKVDIKIYQNGNSEPVFTSSSYISEIETVFNFTSDQVILTDSFYDICYEKLDNYYKRTPNAVGKSGDVNFTIENLWECSSKDLKQISLATGINMETLMQLIIGQKLSTWQKEESNKRDSTINEAITPAVCFALLSQNSITAMPQQLYQDIDEKQEWTDYKNKLVNIAEIGLTQLSPTNIADTLTTASQLNRIPFLMIDDIENISDNIIENNENVRGVEPLLAGGQNITKLIEIAEAAYGFSLSSNPKKDVVTKFIDNSTNFNAFIADLESNKTQDDGTDELVAVFNLSRVTRNFTPLIEKILDSYKDDIKNDIRYVATFSKVNWEGIIIGNNTNGSGYPEDFTSVDEYAQFLVNVCQELYTDIATISLLIEDSEELGLNKLSEIRNALLANTNFNLLTSNYDALDLADDMDAISELRQIQEIYRITPTPEAVRVMFKNKITSASQVYFMGKRELEHRLKDSSLSQANIDSIFDAASGRFANNLNAFFHIQSLLSHASLMAIGGANKENLKDKFPNLKDLFNELDYCECEHDSSVYSAAAYLADLLNFLENRTVQSGKTVKDFLYYDQGNPDNLLRRKDIGKIWLNTQNTNTVLPYIDLVCEVLEEAVLRISYADYEREEEEDYQTTLTAKELLAAPEHILRNKYQNDITAYDILKEKSYPMFAPLNLWQTEIRAYLKFMGIERYQLMEAFQGHDNASGTYTPTHANIAAEYFGLTSLEENLIITSTQPAESEDLRETEEPESANDSNNPWHTELKEDKGLYKMPIADFLQDSGLSVPELIDICNYYYGDTSNIIRWVQLTLESFEDCSYTNKDISGNNASSFDRAHRFIRLYRKSGWKIWELDLLLRSSVAHFNTQNLEGLDNLDAETLSNLMLFKKQQETLKLSVEELLACYAKINTETIIEKGKKKPCLYDRLFLQKSLSDPINQNLSNIKQGKEGASLNDNDQPLITACLSLKESDFQFLQSKWDKSNPYDLSYLTFLYRHGILAKKLKISAEDLFTVFTLLNENIVYDDYYTLSVIDTVIATVAKIKASKLTIAEYEYLALYTCPESTSTRDVTISYKAQELALSKEILDQYTTLLQSALSKAIRPPAENDFFKDEEASTEHWEASIPYKEYFTDYLLATEQYSLEDIEELIRIIECVSDKTDNEIDVFTKQMFISTDYFPVQINLHKEYPLEKEALIVRYKNVGFFVDAGLLSATVINYFSEWFELSAVTVQFYLGYYLGPKYLQGTSFSDMLLNAFEGTNGSLLLLSLHKVSLLINKKQISEADLALLLDMPMPTTQQPFIWYNFTLSVPDGNTLTDFLKLDALLALQKRYGTMGETDTLFSLLSKFAHGTLENNLFFALLCQLTSWDPVQFKQLQQDDALHYKLNDFYDPETYQKMGQCLDIIDKTGVTVSFIETWKLRDNDESLIAQQVKGAAKAHYDLDTWLDKLPAIQNPIREAKSHALSSFLIACSMRGEIDSLRWNDQTELYNYFLLDTEMKPIMKTSRLVQATLSVQLFVQRCLLGLENSAIKTNEDTWQQWEWMKKYRVWEANRKVFLYPENWIEPELRDDKTPFFKDMEDELNQGDITNELAETAFENYLQKLKDVSNLFVCGIYREFVNGNDGQYNGGLILKASKVDTTHVIARSRSTPYQYYYRAYDAIGKKWSYWESVELDIKGDVVIPMIYNRKLHLFWLSPVQKSKNRNTGGEVGDKRAPVNYTEIQLGWSILKNRKFTAVNYSSKKMLIKGQTVTDTFSLIAQYIEARNEIEFSVLQHMEDGDMTVEERTSTASLLTGKFFFNENVYRVNSIIHNAKDIPDGGSQDDDLNTEQKTFKVIAKEMSVEERTELKFVEGNYDRWDEITRNDPDDSTITYYYYDYVIRYPNAALLASRLYSRTGNFYFDLNNESWFPIYSILETQNRPISIKMLHHPDGEWQGRFLSHLDSISFYEDSERSFVIAPYDSDHVREAKYKFSPFYHPYTGLFIKELNRLGIKGLLNREIQLTPQNFYPRNTYNFQDYNPKQDIVTTDYSKDVVDFNFSEAYGPYNWELFFHAPLYIACKLSQNRKFEEAMTWFHYIFNPTDKSNATSPQKFWLTKPFFKMGEEDYQEEDIKNLLQNIQEHSDAVKEWLNNPFNPHLVARTRLVAYQRNVVMKYIDNLINWADQFFRQDSMESNNEATLLYILAYEILGNRPVGLPSDKNKKTATRGYENLPDQQPEQKPYTRCMQAIDQAFAYSYSRNSRINNITNPLFTVPTQLQKRLSSYDVVRAYNSPETLSSKTLSSWADKTEASAMLYHDVTKVDIQSHQLDIAYSYHADSKSLPRIDADNFCIPFNEDLLKYWDTIDDRLFKLRNSMNIEGVVRELPLFEPPIDPAMLVRAVAAGLSIGEALNDITAPQPYYRFRVIMQKAIEFTSEVKQMGDKLLSALEKKDAETLNILRSTQEINMQKALKQVRKLQIDEAKENVENINALIVTATARKEYYESREFMNTLESASYGLSKSAGVIDTIVNSGKVVAAGLKNIPNSYTGGAGVAASLVAIASLPGGESIAGAANMTMDALSIVGHALDRKSSLTATQAGYQRRKEEWDFQAQMADMELVQLDRQLTAAEIRLMMAEKEMENLDMQIEQSQSVKEYYQNKYTSEALYNWMITQISSVYFQAYKLAFDMAKKAENCYRHELGIYESTGFIQFGYWDSLKKGLLSGDKLMHDLHVLEAAYLDKNKRTLELTKHISLAQMYPDKLIELIAAKKTILDLEEFIFDMDYPGHYMRRIKSVSVTIPNVAGPYTAISFMLTLLKAQVRKIYTLAGDAEDPYNETSVGDDSRFVYQTGGSITQRICTSSAQNDSGMFELNFGDERYLPFENAGVISSWDLSFPAACNQFDLSTVSDVILHINYTALYDGRLEEAAKSALKAKLPEFGSLLFSPKQNFPDAWNLMDNANPQMDFMIKIEHLPFFMRGREGIAVTAISMLLSVKKRENVDYPSSLTVILKEEELSLSLSRQDNGNILIYEIAVAVDYLPALGQWNLELNGIALSDIEEIITGFILQTGVEDDGTGGDNPNKANYLLTNSLNKITTNNNQYITLNS